ncbi:hypothetical protein F4779DRAFT_570077 [Xylariaceae sp. FL0662B]|nr:hypothetical protein F4779DRAFT_570077 [Xylariaceae sp. FL0662B]
MTYQRDLSSALVKVEDPEFSRLVCRKLGPQVVSRQAPGTQPIATAVATPIPSGSNTLRVDCRKVHISWHKPYRTVWLNFGAGVVAERVAKRFKEGIYKIRNQNVQCDNPTRGAGRYNPRAWTVCLTEVSASATESDVKESIRQLYDKPRAIELGNPTYDTDVETCSAEIQSLFTSIGPLEWWEFTPDTTGKRMKATARFQNEDDAREAARVLDQSTLPFNKNAKLTSRLVHTARFKVREKIYEAVEAQLRANIKPWKDSHLYYTAYEPDHSRWYRVLKLEGEGAQEVVEAKNTIIKILSGMIAKDGSSVLWHPALRVDGALFEKLKEFEQKFGISVFRNKAKSQLQLYGSPTKCEEGQEAIIKLLKDDGSKHFNIDLDADGFSWALQGGFKEIVNEVGPEKAIFDIASTPKRILIIGTTGNYDTAISIKDRKKMSQKKGKVSNNQECSVCWGEAEDAIQTQCGHVYCLDCFENLCFSAMTQNTEARVCCVGESGNCTRTLELPELQEHLLSTAFEELLEKSFASYARHHPDVFSYCPSKDCGCLYRINATPSMQTCPGCLELVCTSCQAQHSTMTCADYKDISSGGYEAFERVKKVIGIRDCPKCKTPLEKTDGCNHITCLCGAHICWVCLRTFTISDDCYTHMTREHKGIGLNHLQ